MPKATDASLTIKLLKELDKGRKVFLHHIKTPIYMSDRSVVHVYYWLQTGKDPNEFSYIQSSVGNEDLENEFSDILKDDVVIGAEMVMNVKPHPQGGSKLRVCVTGDPGGMLPEFVKKKVFLKMPEVVEQMENYIRKNFH